MWLNLIQMSFIESQSSLIENCWNIANLVSFDRLIWARTRPWGPRIWSDMILGLSGRLIAAFTRDIRYMACAQFQVALTWGCFKRSGILVSDVVAFDTIAYHFSTGSGLRPGPAHKNKLWNYTRLRKILWFDRNM